MSLPRPAVAGRFITVEGIDGAGKSSHLDALALRWEAQGLEVVRTREPGGSPLGEALRELLLQRPMDALTEALLMFAARRDHLQACIEPARARGAVVLSDRHADASFAYQGGGRGLGPDILGTLEAWVAAGPAGAACRPDLTFWFDLPPAVAATRRAAARAADRFEAEDLAFFRRVQAAYAARAAAEPDRILRIDADRPREQVAASLVAALEARGW